MAAVLILAKSSTSRALTCAVVMAASWVEVNSLACLVVRATTCEVVRPATCAVVMVFMGVPTNNAANCGVVNEPTWSLVKAAVCAVVMPLIWSVDKARNCAVLKETRASVDSLAKSAVSNTATWAVVNDAT